MLAPILSAELVTTAILFLVDVFMLSLLFCMKTTEQKKKNKKLKSEICCLLR